MFMLSLVARLVIVGAIFSGANGLLHDDLRVAVTDRPNAQASSDPSPSPLPTVTTLPQTY